MVMTADTRENFDGFNQARRDFLRLLVVGGITGIAGGILRSDTTPKTSVTQPGLKTINTGNARAASLDKDDSKYESYLTAVDEGVEIKVAKFSSPAPYQLFDRENLSKKILPVSYRVGALDLGQPDYLSFGRAEFLGQKTSDKNSLWNDKEAIVMAKALARSRKVNMSLLNYDNFGKELGVRRNGGLIFLKESNWPFDNDQTMFFVPHVGGDVVHVRNLGTKIDSTNEDLVGEVASQYSKSLNWLVDVRIGTEEIETSLLPALIEGMGASADYSVTGRWRLTSKSIDELQRDVVGRGVSFSNSSRRERSTLAGMAVREIEGRYPYILGHVNSELEDLVISRYGKDGLTQILKAGKHPIVSVDEFLKIGDESSDGKSFSSWLKSQPVFSMRP